MTRYKSYGSQMRAERGVPENPWVFGVIISPAPTILNLKFDSNKLQPSRKRTLNLNKVQPSRRSALDLNKLYRGN